MQANSYSSPGTTGGNREDLRDVLTILEPEETPFTSMCKKGASPKSTYIEVMADTLRAVRKTGTPEGRDAGRGGNKVLNRQRFGTNVHRVMDEFAVSDVQELISKNGGTAAIDDEYANSKAKAIRETKRDIEAIACSDNEMQAGTDEADMQTRGIYKWLSPTAQTVHPVPASFRPATAQVLSGVTAVTEAQLNDVLIACKRAYGAKRTYQGLAGDTVIKTVDNFTRVNSSTTNARYSVREDASDHEITMMVRIFESSHARLELMPTQFNKVDAAGADDVYTMYILNMELWEMQFLDALHAVDLPDQGGGPRGFVKAIFGLLCKHPKGNGMIYNS
jgi:hypothetical protein